jgi:hypothetical protein
MISQSGSSGDASDDIYAISNILRIQFKKNILRSYESVITPFCRDNTERSCFYALMFSIDRMRCWIGGWE